MPPRPGTVVRPTPADGCRSTKQVADELDVTVIRLHRLVKAGHITPAGTAEGSGSRIRWSDQDLAEARRIIARIDWGMTPEAAARRSDPPLPAPQHGHDAPPWVHAVLPSEIVRQRQLGWPDFHPEDFCHICGRRNSATWTAPAVDWNAVIDGHGGIFCPSCWAALYEDATGQPRTHWWVIAQQHGEPDPAIVAEGA